jgi:TonB family protein
MGELGMVFEVLAAVIVTAAPPDASVAQPAPATEVRGAASVSPVVVPPLAPKTPPAATIDVPSDDRVQGGVWASVWPQDAYRGRIAGHVILTCEIDRYGLAEACRVTSEIPGGKGFGAAALELRPTFKVTPANGPDGPTAALMNIAVNFDPPDPHFDFGRGRTGGPVGERAGSTNLLAPQQEFSDLTSFGNPLQRRSIAMLNNPVWSSTVSYADLVRAYPPKAGGMEGYAVAHCQVSAKGGALSGCMLIKEDPDKHGFGKAALALAAQFKVAPEWAKAPGHPQLWVDIPFRFPAPGGSENRRIETPYWVSGFDPEQALKVYPPEAASKGLASGHGIAKCIVGPDGTLGDCAPVEADPEGLGFSEAAAKLAATMRMNPWTADGSPVDGAVVRVGVRLDLKPETEAAPPTASPG